MVGNVSMTSPGRDGLDSARVGEMKQRLFKKLDADADGSLNAEEISAFKPPRLEGRGDIAAPDANELIAIADTDGDQRLSEEEFLSARPPAGNSGVPFDLRLESGGGGVDGNTLQTAVASMVMSALRQYLGGGSDTAPSAGALGVDQHA